MPEYCRGTELLSYTGGMTRRLIASLVVVVCLGSGAWGQLAPPQAWPTTNPALAVQGIPPQVVGQMYQRELGRLYVPQYAQRLYEAHRLMEQYFATPAAAERKAIVAKIEGLQVDPNLLGRIVRIRLHWPQLEAGVYYLNERVGVHGVAYFMGIPKGYDRARAWPLVIKLPGAHAFVTDPKPGPAEVAQLYTGWMQEELRAHPDAVVLMPLLDLKELWGPSYKGMNSVIQPMHHAFSRVNIDPARVYLSGHGMSGHATWNLALHYPTYFAAINPMSGGATAGWQRVRLLNLRNVYAVAWHGGEDPLVKVEASRGVVKVLRQHKYDVDYEETPKAGHVPSEEILERLYGKVRARVRELYPRQVAQASNRPDTLFNRNDWVQVYQLLNPGEEKKVGVIHGTGTIAFQQNTYNITAAISKLNEIDIKTSNVESMRVYLNDQMVDFSRPIVVRVNGKQRFGGMVTPSTEEMLKDQVFLGRGWRYYTGFIDVDFGLPSTQPATAPTTRRGAIHYVAPK